MGGEVCGLPDRASPITQAEGGRLALQVPSPERTRLAVPVKMTADRLRTAQCGHRLDRHEGQSRESGHFGRSAILAENPNRGELSFVRWALVGAGASNRRPVRIEYPMANCRVWSRRATMGVPDRTTFESAYNGEAP